MIKVIFTLWLIVISLLLVFLGATYISFYSKAAKRDKIERGNDDERWKKQS